MSTIVIELAQGLTGYVFKQLKYKIFYHFPQVATVDYEEHPARLLIAGEGGFLEGFGSSIQQLAQELQLVNRSFKQELVVYQRASSEAAAVGGTELFAKGVISVGDGRVIYRGFALQLIDRVRSVVDGLFGRIAQDQIRVPSSIDLAQLNQINYVPSFHHHLCFVSHLDPEVEKMKAFPAAWAARGDHVVPRQLGDFTASPTLALNPAVCLHVYHMLAAQRSEASETSSWVAASGKVFRFESANHSPLERLFEFTMHELVHVAAQSEVEESGKKLAKMLEGLAEALRLDCKLVVANDMFIGERDQQRMFAQLSTQSKIEFMVRLPPEDRYLAAGSLNLHGQHFTQPLGIHDPATQTLSASLCLGIGLERLALALAAQHGAAAIDLLDATDIDALIRQSGLAAADHR